MPLDAAANWSCDVVIDKNIPIVAQHLKSSLYAKLLACQLSRLLQIRQRIEDTRELEHSYRQFHNKLTLINFTALLLLVQSRTRPAREQSRWTVY